MIWFVCKQCGKHHGRAENLAGTLVFCECGHGNRVPWSSTVPEPEPEAAQAVPSAPPREEGRPEPAFPRPRYARARRRPNPAYCLNHEETPKEATCDVCHCSFCSACVVTMQGQTLCGPCKNFRIRERTRPPRLASLAIVAFILALITTLASLFLAFLALGMELGLEQGIFAALIFCSIALLLAAGELVVGWLALRQIDRQPALAGRALAMTGATAGAAGIVWSLAVAAFSIAKEFQG
jgi:hypothetical protein